MTLWSWFIGTKEEKYSPLETESLGGNIDPVCVSERDYNLCGITWGIDLL